MLTNDATTALLRAMRASILKLAPCGAVIFEEIRSRPWASVTFAGARHALVLLVSGPGAQAGADAFSAGLDTAEFKLRGHILADIALMSREPAGDGVRLRIEALTVEE